MDGRITSHEIERAASGWVARMDRGPLSAEDNARLQHWLASDVRCRGALLRAKAVWLQSESLRGTGQLHELHTAPRGAVSRPPRRVDPRRQLIFRWSGAVAASLMLAVFLFVSVPIPTAYATAKGEMRRIPLSDGSTLTLNTESRIKVYEDHGRVRVKVLHGEVYVEAADSAMPLQVEMDGRKIAATAAEFVVRRLDDQPAQVVVRAGRIDIPDAGVATTLAANMRLAVPAHGGQAVVGPLTDADMQRELAWREGKIAFQGETLADAARSFTRYSATRLVIADADLASEPVTGLFATNNPAGFARAVAASFGAQVRQQDGEVIVSRR